MTIERRPAIRLDALRDPEQRENVTKDRNDGARRCGRQLSDHWVARVLVDEHEQIRAASQRAVEVDAEVRPRAGWHRRH